MVIDDAPQGAAARPVSASRGPWVATALGLLVAVLAGGGLALGLAARALALVGGTARPSVDTLVEGAVCGTGALVAGWLAASALLALGCLSMRLVGSSWRHGERWVQRWAPAAVRRALVVVVGASVGLGVVGGASATTDPVTGPSPAGVSATTDDLGWIVTTPADRASTVSAIPSLAPSAPPAAPAEAPAPAPALLSPPVLEPGATPVAASAEARPEPSPPPVTDGRPVVVVAGDSLWAIAARHLAPDATDAQIAESWPRWYRANGAVIGPDPGHIVPGQALVTPATPDGAAS